MKLTRRARRPRRSIGAIESCLFHQSLLDEDSDGVFDGMTTKLQSKIECRDSSGGGPDGTEPALKAFRQALDGVRYAP